MLIDTPPLLSVTDAGILASTADGVVMAVSTGETHVEALKAAKKSLEKVGAHILGVVLTKVEMDKNNSYYYHYDYNYSEEPKILGKRRKWLGIFNK
ncbi:hypothetical protein [Anaerotalea alkaliphila]|uniref:hypothetical protein n=1 Tax=Anaerotalea alkaliphila TaxID=2662126 RepID=UPI001FEB921F|nr:hypothetical protein [Anaerotalea alkaliphila]